MVLIEEQYRVTCPYRDFDELDLFAEKPFGIDLGSAERIAAAVKTSGRFVRVSSEFPFLPGAQRAMAVAKSGALGRVIEVRVGYLHSSDLDPKKPVNWKRQAAFCGEIGVLGDLGMHALHVPLRLGWMPKTVFAQLQHATGGGSVQGPEHVAQGGQPEPSRELHSLSATKVHAARPSLGPARRLRSRPGAPPSALGARGDTALVHPRRGTPPHAQPP